MAWKCSIVGEPAFDPKFPLDPVDWEAELTDGKDTIYVTFTGTYNEDETALVPWPEDEMEERLTAMLKGLNGD